MLEYSVLYIAKYEEEDSLYNLLTNNFRKINRTNTYSDVIDIITNYRPHIVVVDMDSSYMNGLDIVRMIKSYVPFIQTMVISSKKSVDDLVSAIDLSIGCFLFKPLDEMEYLKAVQKISHEVLNHEMIKEVLNKKESNTYVRLSKECLFDKDKKMLVNDNTEVALNNNECKLFELLIKHKGSVVTYDQIEDYIWDRNSATKGALRNLVYTLRKKLPTELLENYSKVGYILKVEHL
jgi:DNA-binding response OmpR family regulator